MDFLRTFPALALLLLRLQVPGIAALPAPLDARAADAARAAARVVEHRIADVSRRETYARILFVWGFFESAWQANPAGSNDQGSACGVMQLHSPEIFIEGATCQKARASLVVGFDAGLAAIAYFEKKCGTLAAALTAYSTRGECPKAGYVLPLVAKRCALAGVDCGK